MIPDFAMFLEMLDLDSEIRTVKDNVFRECSDALCGECIRTVFEYYYLKYLVMGKIDKKIAEDLKKCLRKR